VVREDSFGNEVEDSASECHAGKGTSSVDMTRE